MRLTLGTHDLPDGQRVEIALVQAPDRQYRDAILTLLAHKGGAWETHMIAALDGAAGSLETRWYLGIIDDRPVANVMTVEQHGVGILGHVYTQDGFRRQGICKAILTHAMADFRSRNGQALILGTGYDSVPYRIYHSFGFRSLRGGFMQYTSRAPEDFDRDWFSGEAADVTTAAWEHWPLVAMLAARPDGSNLRSVAWGLRDMGNLEGPYCEFMRLRSEGAAEGTVTVTRHGAAVACATCVPFRIGWNDRPWPDTWLVDAFAHPHYSGALEATIRALPWRSGKSLALVRSTDEERIAAFCAAGFSCEGMIPGLIASGSYDGDIQVLGVIRVEAQ